MANSNPRDEEGKGEAPAPDTIPATARPRKKRISMHEGIGVWCDCCSCEAEPRWAALAEEFGFDLSDYEDEDEMPASGAYPADKP